MAPFFSVDSIDESRSAISAILEKIRASISGTTAFPNESFFSQSTEKSKLLDTNPLKVMSPPSEKNRKQCNEQNDQKTNPDSSTIKIKEVPSARTILKEKTQIDGYYYYYYYSSLMPVDLSYSRLEIIVHQRT